MIQRKALQELKNGLSKNKVVVVRGPRQTGKLTIVQQVFSPEHSDVLYIDCSVKSQRAHFLDQAEFAKITNNKLILVIQNSQFLNNVNDVIDWCFDAEKLENIVLICSYEPEMDNAFWEVFRTSDAEIIVNPLSYEECAEHFGLSNEDKVLDERLVFGYYPEVVSADADVSAKEETLLAVLEKAIIRHFAGERINKKEQLIKLLRKLAYQIGEVISYNELGNDCDLDNETVERYILLFEKAGILFKLPSYFTTHKYELKKSFMVYFCDNGIRNALIRAFQPMEFRNDVEQLWKNWALSERRKMLSASTSLVTERSRGYFWLTHTKQRVDYLELSDTSGSAFQLQLSKKAKLKIPKSFVETYPEYKVTAVNRGTFIGFLKKK